MPLFIATTTSTFRHAYLIEADNQSAALDVIALHKDTLDDKEWYQEHLGETLTDVNETTLSEVTVQHEQTLRDKTNWWLPVETFIVREGDPSVSEPEPSDKAPLDPRVTNMEATILRDPVFMSRATDRTFAIRLYSTLCNTSWRHEDCPDPTVEWSCSWRYAGGLVADLRNAVCADAREDYIDYYCQGNEGRIDSEVAARLKTLGWHGQEIRVPD